MNTTDIQKLKDDLKGECDLVNDTIVRTREDMEQAKRELATLEAGLPKLLAQFHLGKITKSEIIKAKKKRRDLREFFEDSAYILVGLEDYLRILNTRGTQLSLLDKQIRRYETLKTELSNRHRTDLENELLGLAHELSSIDDAKDFLDSVKQKVKS